MELLTERLRLREFEADDWRAVLDYQRDPLYLRYYPWEDRSEADARAFVEMFLGWQTERPRRRFQLAIARRDDDSLIGNCGIRRKPDNEWEADIGYELSPQHWGQGYATEAARAVVEFGFADLGLQRISSWCIADNIASVRALERLGVPTGRTVTAERIFQRAMVGYTIVRTAGGGVAMRPEIRRQLNLTISLWRNHAQDRAF